MSELRKDPVINRWVITLDDKNFVPHPEYRIPSGLPEKDPLCPFCPGNEDKTGKTISLVKGKNAEWSVRVIPNNNPYLKVETELKKKGVSIFDVISGTGANEVIIETPCHNCDIDGLETGHVADILKTYRERMADLLRDSRLEYILIFRNRGLKAGAHVIHPHSQLMGLPVVPLRVNEEMESAKHYHDFKKRCVYCDIIENESQMGQRVIKESEFFLAIAPFASRTCFETWILPKNHRAHFHKADDRELKDLALVLKDTIGRINRALGKPCYNYMIHTAPAKQGDLDYFHWHIELLPRVKSMAGFEWGSGFDINPVLPEEAAEYLRNL
jgi:UDPglucose--hexose-1-phosphate uridylyltransferase